MSEEKIKKCLGPVSGLVKIFLIVGVGILGDYLLGVPKGEIYHNVFSTAYGSISMFFFIKLDFKE